MKRSVLTYAAIGVSSLILMFGIVGPTIVLAQHLPILSNKETLIHNKSQGVLLYDRNDKLIGTYGDPLRRRVVSLDQIPTHTKQAILAMEDREFYSHHGFSARGIARAIRKNVKTKSLGAGGSTITQQVAKNTMLTSERTFWRKYQESILSLALERLYSKEDILDIYLNTIYMGEGAYGLGEAALTYFNKPVEELTLAESTYLAGLIAAPSLYGGSTADAEGKARQGLVLQSMRDVSYITEEESQTVRKTTLEFQNRYETATNTSPHFALYIYDRIRAEFGEDYLRTAGLRVTTTLDSQLQAKAEDIVRDHVRSLRARGATNGAAVVLDPTNGEILAMVGAKIGQTKQMAK